ncbi:MAG: metal ABC transporter solute-binding protein, Zn/Mn family [Sedimentibacter sp.]
MKMKMKTITKKVINTILGLTLTLGLLFVTSCMSNGKTTEINKDTGDEAVEKPIIAVTIVPEETFVKAVCGNLAEVITLVPPGSSPENYEPTPQLMEKFSKSSIYFSIGVPTEQANILPKIGGIKVVSLADEVAAIYQDGMFESGERDPHIWLSPKRVKVMIDTIQREMSILDPTNKSIYEKNATAYIKELDELDKQVAIIFDGSQNKEIIVYHPAFGYLANDYGLKMYALEDEGKEASAKHLQDIIDLAKKENIKAIFYQEEIDSRQSQAFAEEIGGKSVQLAPLAADYIENFKIMAEMMAGNIQ